MGFAGGSDSKESDCNVGDLGLILGSGSFPWRREWQPTPVVFFFFFPFFFLIYFFLFVVNFVIHWNEKALGSYVFPIPIPPPTSLPTRSLQVLPEHQVRALVSCIQPGPGDTCNPMFIAVLQYSCLENPMVRGAWRTTVHGVTTSQTRLSN